MGCATPSAGPAACTVTGSIESAASTSHDARAELPRPDVLAAHFGIDPGIVFLNHGSFGATPRAVREAQARAVDLVERDSTRFYVELLEDLLAESRSALASFVGADADDLMIVANVTEAVNTVFHSAKLEPGDEILVTSHEYPACVRAAEVTAGRFDAKVVIAELPWPMTSEDEIVQSVLSRVGPKTRLALISHVTSPTAAILPIERLVRELEGRGVDVLVDGAHAPGMLPLDLNALNPAYYTGNCHKWMCAPRASGFLRVRRDRRGLMKPLTVSLSSKLPRCTCDPFRLDFDYVGTRDMSPVVAIPESIRFMDSLFDGGWPELMRRQRALALSMRDVIAARLGVTHVVPEDVVGCLAVVQLPDTPKLRELSAIKPRYHHALQERLLDRWRIQVPIIPFPTADRAMVRVSAAVHNSIAQAEYLAEALAQELGV